MYNIKRQVKLRKTEQQMQQRNKCYQFNKNKTTLNNRAKEMVLYLINYFKNTVHGGNSVSPTINVDNASHVAFNSFAYVAALTNNNFLTFMAPEREQLKVTLKIITYCPWGS